MTAIRGPLNYVMKFAQMAKILDKIVEALPSGEEMRNIHNEADIAAYAEELSNKLLQISTELSGFSATIIRQVRH